MLAIRCFGRNRLSPLCYAESFAAKTNNKGRHGGHITRRVQAAKPFREDQ